MAVSALVFCSAARAAEETPWPGESWTRSETPEGIRAVTLSPSRPDPRKPSLHIVYATPNGNTVEQTLGCKLAPGMDWHYDIQHVAAQVRMLRAEEHERNVYVTVAEAKSLSWPTWRSKTTDANLLISKFVSGLVEKTPGSKVKAVVSGHSGGGSFVLGFIEGNPSLPDWVERVIFLDANYSFDESKGHGSKLLEWLDGDASRRLVVLAYDDRNVTLNGKRIVSSTGGTYRSTERMVQFFERSSPVASGKHGQFLSRSWKDGRALFLVHPNPQLKILHTAMIGEMNGLLFAFSTGSALESKIGRLGEPRSYTRYVQDPRLPSEAAIPGRPAGSRGGAELMKAVADLPREQRETALQRELISGNMPKSARIFRPVTISKACSDGKTHTIALEVLSDYLTIGSDEDSVRVCVNPYTAQAAADAFGCSLPTRAIVDAVWKQSDVKLEPLPLTDERESPLTFLRHDQMIDSQFSGVAKRQLVAGCKKDVVITPLLKQKPHRVAIYGWHKPDGSPIQPLTTVHVDWYVDYSHGTRLIKRLCRVDGKPADLNDILADSVLSALVSDEGPVVPPRYAGTVTP